MTATEVLGLIETAAGGDFGPLDAAIEDLTELAAGLERARKSLARTAEPDAEPEAAPIPKARPGRRPKAVAEANVAASGSASDNWRAAIARLLTERGPLKPGKVQETLGCNQTSYQRATAGHPWFVKEDGLLRLTADGQQAVRKLTGTLED